MYDKKLVKGNWRSDGLLQSSLRSMDRAICSLKCQHFGLLVRRDTCQGKKKKKKKT